MNHELNSTMQPFAPGDVFVGATLLNNPDDDHAGKGRIIQYDEHLNEKGMLWTEGTSHLISGLSFGPDNNLWAFDGWSWLTIRVSPDGKQLPNRQYAERCLSGVYFADDGSMYFTEGVDGHNQPEPLTTRHKPLPGESSKLGDGDIYHFSSTGDLLATYDPDVHGGMSGSMAVTHGTLSADKSRLIYVSETGPRLMQFDLNAGKQLGDLQRFEEHKGEMFFDLTSTGDGRLLITRGARLDILDEQGNTLKQIPLAEFGWSLVATSDHSNIAYVGNWFSGVVARLNIESGEISAQVTIAPKCIAGIAQYPG